MTHSIETERRHALEVERKDLLVVHDLESKLGLSQRWTADDPQWKEAEIMAGKRTYQRCLDTLEGLIISRMFELTKMNMSQTGRYLLRLTRCRLLTYSTGYKLRKHIGNTLKARSQAVRNALDRYNAAAQALIPPRARLIWDSVVEYTFLSDFDLLSDMREDIQLRPWAKPAARALMDQHFKLERAREEIARLNVEIPRLSTFIRDKEAFLLRKEEALSTTNAPLARQLQQQRLRLVRLNDQHYRRLSKLASLPGFTGSLIPGVSIEAANTPTAMDTSHSSQEVTVEALGARVPV